MKTSSTMRNFVLISVIALLAAATGCGNAVEGDASAGPDNTSVSGNTSSSGEQALTGSWEKVIASNDYTGQLAFKFKTDTTARLRTDKGAPPSLSKGLNFIREAEFISLSGRNLSRVTQVVRNSNSATVSRTIPNISEEDFESIREKYVEKGVEYPDWNLTYIITDHDKTSALEIYKQLKEDDTIEWVEPVLKKYLANVTDVTPDYSSGQDYLKPSATNAGVNALAGWAAGAYGQGVTIGDYVLGWNFNHEDLPIDLADVITTMPAEMTQAEIDHGTAVIGVIAGLHNDAGVKGIAPQSHIKLLNADDPWVGFTASWTDSEGKTIRTKPGDVLMIEVQVSGTTNTTCGGTATAQDGCLPVETSNLEFQTISSLVANGFVVVEGAGNGSVDLSSPIAHLEGTTGAIMVGASLGPTKQKAPWSNCGPRVDLFSWGGQVLTTGYGDYNPSQSDPNKRYTANFSGTSSATSIIGGVAAQLQSYVKAKLADAGIVDIDRVYIDNQKMKELLVQSGVSAVYGTNGDTNPNCNIGKQPDVAAAINLINSGFIEEFNFRKEYTELVAEVAYDVDGDDKSDVIGLDRNFIFHIDLSSVESNAAGAFMGFGEYDVTLDFSDYTPAEGMYFPVVADINADGFADLGVYDSLSGKLYVHYTDRELFDGIVDHAGGGWSRIVDYSEDSNWQQYFRPQVFDKNSDGYLDIVFQSADGQYLFDLNEVGDHVVINEDGRVEFSDTLGDLEVQSLLNAAQLAEAPGWAYQNILEPGITLKSPDGTTNPTNMTYPMTLGSTVVVKNKTLGLCSTLTELGLGCNSDINYHYMFGYYGLKFPDGKFLLVDYNNPGFYQEPTEGFGGVDCRPIPADYNGDGLIDRATYCGSSFRVAFSNESVLRVANYTDSTGAIPAYIHQGGIKYTDILAIYNSIPSSQKPGCHAGQTCTIFDAPPPIGPRFAECVANWARPPQNCWGE